jgi:uncharacterized protein (DUF736 family)
MKQIIGKFQVAYDTGDIFGWIRTLMFGVDRVEIVFNKHTTSDEHRFLVIANECVLGIAAYSRTACVFLDVRLDGPGLMAPICCELVCMQRDHDGEDAKYDLVWERKSIRTKATSEEMSCRRTSCQDWDRGAGPFCFDDREICDLN